jgi:hypothetical protein
MADQFQYIKLPDGSYGKFPTSASDDQIRTVLASQFPKDFAAAKASAAPTDTISARPGGVRTWLQDLQGDIQYGSGNTLPGRMLKAAGAPGINKGVSEGAAQQVAGPLIGPANTALAAMDIPKHPISGTLRTLGGVLQTAGPATAFYAPEAGEAAQTASGIPGAIAKRMVPNVASAAQKFEEVGNVAKDVPVSLTNSSEAAIKLMDWQKKTQLGPTINKFLNRVTSPNQGPLTYDEARGFYKILGRLSADEASKLPDPVKYDLTQMVRGLKQDIGDAAGTVGKGDQYYSAMQEFSKAKKLEDLKASLVKYGVKPAIGAGAATVGAKAGYDFYNNMKK